MASSGGEGGPSEVDLVRKQDTGSEVLIHTGTTTATKRRHPRSIREAWYLFLSINDSWSSRWWYGAAHNITAVIGAGVLSLYASMADLGWAPGVFVLILLGVISLATMWQMIELHELDGQRMDRYHELGQKAFGKKLGLWIIVPLQLLVESGIDTVYMLVAGKSIRKIYSLVRGCQLEIPSLGSPRVNKLCDLKLRYCIMVFAAIQFSLSQLPNFTSITWVSIIAAAMSIGYSTIAWIAALIQKRRPDVRYDNKADVFDVFGAVGQIAFAFAGHNVVLEIQATMPSTIERPSNISAWHGALAAYAVILFCYFPNALVGYYMFGNNKNNNNHVLEALESPSGLVAAGNIMVVVHMCGGYQIFAMSLVDTVENYLIKKWKAQEGFLLRLIVRTLYVALTCFVAISVPFIGDIQTVISGLAFVPTTFLIPAIIWQRIHKPRPLSLHWLANWASIIIGVGLTVMATIGGFRNMLRRASNYEFFND